jgi:sugar-specific transcriptional regulator TrmB
MPISEFKNEIQTLTRLGLTPRQGKVYLAVLRLGFSTVKTISKLSAVPREDVYRVMPSLQRLGLVEKSISVPTKFKAIPIEAGLSILLRRKTEEYVELLERTEKFRIDLIKNNAKKATQEDAPDYIMVPSKGPWHLKMRDMVQNVQMSLDIVIPWKRYAQFTFSYPAEIKQSMKKDVQIRLVTEKPPSNPPLANSLPSGRLKKSGEGSNAFRIRYTSTALSATVVICDKREVCINTSATARIGDTPTLWSKNPCLLAIAQNYFDMNWAVSTEDS